MNWPSGLSTMASGPMPAKLWVMPVPNAAPTNGASTSTNCDAWVEASEGTPSSACLNRTLVEGAALGAGGTPMSTVVPPTLGVLPRLMLEPSSGTPFSGGLSRLPALSVDKAMKSTWCPAAPE